MSEKSSLQEKESVLQARLAKLVNKAHTVNPSKVPGLCKMITACLEFLEDPALIHPISLASYEERMHEFLNYCQGYLHQKKHWSNLLQQLDLSHFRTVCELCPGLASKAIWGLATTSFKGEVSVLDFSSKALAHIRLWNEFLCLPFLVEDIQIDLFTFKGRKFDLLMANHILDDLVLHAFAKDLAQQEHQTPEDFFLKKCESALNKKSELPSLTNQLASTFYNLLNPYGQMVILEYPSLYGLSHDHVAWEEALEQARVSLFDALQDLGLKKTNVLDALVFSKI